MFAPHGGGAFSGKDATKVDRSGAYMARYIAKNLVAAGLCERCQVTLAYAIGAAQPVMVEVDTFKTGTVCADDCLADAVKLVFGLTPAEIIAKAGSVITEIYWDRRLWTFRQAGVPVGTHRSGENPAGGCHLSKKGGFPCPESPKNKSPLPNR